MSSSPRNGSTTSNTVPRAHMVERFARAGGHYAFKQRVVLPVLALLSYGTAFNDVQRFGSGSMNEWITIAVIAGVLAWAWFSVIAGMCDRLLPARPVLRGMIAALLYMTTEAIRAVAVAYFLVAFGILDGIDWPFRIIAGALTGLILFGLVSIVLNDAWSYREQRIQLGMVQSSLRQAVAMRRVDLERRFARLSESVRDAVAAALRAIGDEHPNAPASARVAASELTRIADEVVRPLAHDMYREISFEHEAGDIEDARVTFRAVVDRASVVAPFRPEATVVVAGFLMVGQAIFGHRGWEGAIAFVWGLVIVYVVLSMARRFITPQLPALPVAARWAVIWGFGVVFAATGGYLLSRSLIGANGMNPIFQLVYTVLLAMLMLTVLAAGPGLRLARSEALAEIAESNRNLRWQNARLNAQLLAEQKAVARALHRDVQGVLVAASLRLEEAVRRGDSVEQASVEVRELIEMATNFAVARQPTPLIQTLIQQLSELWRNVLTLEFHLSEPAILVLNRDPIARRIFSEVIGEFCLDSVKHGQARRVRVSAPSIQDDSLTIHMENDGAPVSDLPERGLGTLVLSSSAIRFERSNIAGGVRVEVELPVEGK